MNKNMFLSVAMMMSVNAEVEQKPGIFKRCKKHIRNNRGAYDLVAITMLITGLSMLSYTLFTSDSQAFMDLMTEHKIENTRSKYVEQMQNISWNTLKYAVISGIHYYTFDFQYLTEAQCNQLLDIMLQIFNNAPDAIMVYPNNTFSAEFIARYKHLKIMTDHQNDENFDLIYNTDYWNYNSKDIISIMNTHHLTAKQSKKEIMIMTAKSSDTENAMNATKSLNNRRDDARSQWYTSLSENVHVLYGPSKTKQKREQAAYKLSEHAKYEGMSKIQLDSNVACLNVRLSHPVSLFSYLTLSSIINLIQQILSIV